MLTAQLKTTSVLIILFLTIAFAAKAIGSLQPINPVLRGFIEGCENKPQPCWYGIILEKTFMEDVAHILAPYQFDAGIGYRSLYGHDGLEVLGLESPGNDCHVLLSSSYGSSHVNRFVFEDCSGVQFGQLRSFISSTGSAFAWTCGYDESSLIMNYPSIMLVINDMSFIPPRDFTKVDAFIIYVPNVTAYNQALLDEQVPSNPLYWRYLKLAFIDSGCPEG